MTVFEADNDLSVGNVTLSVGRLQSTALSSRGAVLVVGPQGLLTETEKLVFDSKKGVLNVPALQFERLAGGFNAKGYEVSNAVLTNARLTGAAVSATEFKLEGGGAAGGGLAYFNARGVLQVRNAVKHLLLLGL